jgi:hypothetical protein
MFGFLAILALLAVSARGQSSEYKLEAAYLCRFVDFVAWPSDAFTSPDSPLVIGVLGHDPFGKVLENLTQGQTSRGHPLVVRRFGGLKDVQHCQVLYVSSDETGDLGKILRALDGRPILTVSDVRDFAERGGMIRFFTERNKLRFRVNLQAAKARQLSISSRLLQLAEVIKGEPAAP